ncbi:Vgb family protein [Gilliamella sp. wkB178]|uniref:Vgb family protein n=1 Tax=Gilliamella sp. wkB178 TaxID=3120259 RepID=UPI0011468C06|nr:serine/threonine protein kinase [Gilliamella apicola]
MAEMKTVSSSFSAPTGIAFDSSGAMYVTNWSGNSITKIKNNTQKETIYSNISSPAGIVIDNKDNIYVSSYGDDYILKIDTNGKAQKVSEGYHTPTGIAFSNDGHLLITNRSTGEIVSLDLNNGNKQIIAKGLSTPVGVTQLPDNSLVVSQYSGRLTLIKPNGEQIEIGKDFVRPGVGIVTTSPDTVAVIDNGADMVRKINIKTYKVETIAASLSGAVALALHNNQFYIGTWGDGSVHMLDNN